VHLFVLVVWMYASEGQSVQGAGLFAVFLAAGIISIISVYSNLAISTRPGLGMMPELITEEQLYPKTTIHWACATS
jgi:hypothetical protein